jgi:hypothetical protein
MTRKHVAVSIACALLVFEAGITIKAIRSRSQARMLLALSDRLRLGKSTKAQTEKEISSLGLAPIDEGCSAVSGICEGLSVEIHNYPVMSSNGFWRGFSLLISQSSIFRPTELIGNFYFHDGRLNNFFLVFGSGNTYIASELAMGEDHSESKHEWDRNNHTGSFSLTRVINPEDSNDYSIGTLGSFDLRCMTSLFGCRSESALWPMQGSRN